RPFGAGGLPARGELRLKTPLIRTLGNLHAQVLRGKRVLLIGHGHSAANAINALVDAEASVTWAVRTANRRPCQDIANDPLAERQRVVRRANDLAESPPRFLTVERRATIETIADNGHFDVTFTGGGPATVPCIAAFPRYPSV